MSRLLEPIRKNFQKEFFLEKAFEKDYDLPFGDFFVAALAAIRNEGRKFFIAVFKIDGKAELFATYSRAIVC